MSSILLDNIRVVWGGALVLAIDTLEISDGELLVVLGPSGSGKTTLLRVIAGLSEPTSGHVYFDGVDVTDVATSDRGVAMVFQENALYPFKDVRGNVAFPLEIRHTPASEVSSRVEAEARVLAIEHLLSRKPNQLGAGHQQLAQAARALVRVPQVFLMDEPLARLDAHLRVLVRQEFRLLQQGYGVTTVFVTNDQDEAMAVADQIAVLNEGRVLQVASPLDLYRRPDSKSVAQFVGSRPMGFVPGRVVAESPGFWLNFGDFRLRAWTPTLERAPGGRVEVGVRPEDVVLDPRGIAVRVGKGYFVGSHGYAQVELVPGCMVEMRTEAVPPAPGEMVNIKLRHLHIFHPETGSVLGRIEDDVN
jgi:multiple sugar transport system ATP-binding protein